MQIEPIISTPQMMQTTLIFYFKQVLTIKPPLYCSQMTAVTSLLQQVLVKPETKYISKVTLYESPIVFLSALKKKTLLF